MLGLEPEKTIYDLVVAPGELDPEKLAGYVTKHACGLDVLPAPLRPEDAELVVEARSPRLLEVARARTTRSSSTRRRSSTARCWRRSTAPTSCSPLRARRPDDEERPARAADARAALVPDERIRFVMNRANTNVGLKQARGRDGLEREDPLPAAERPRGAGVASTAATRRARRPRCRLLAGDARRSRRSCRRPDAGTRRRSAASPAPGEGARWASTIASHAGRRRSRRSTARCDGRRSRRRGAPQSIHTPSSRPASTTQCIAKLGPELFKQDGSDRPRRQRLPGGHRGARARPDAAHARGAPPARPRRSPTTSSATGRSSRSSRDDTVTEVMVNGSDRVYIERDGKIERDRRPLRRRRAPAAHHRQDRLAGRPPRRRGLADGRRAPARRQPRERDHPAAGAHGPDAHDPQVLARPVHDRRPDRVRDADAAGRRSSSPRASRASSTSSSPAVPAPARRRR